MMCLAMSRSSPRSATTLGAKSRCCGVKGPQYLRSEPSTWTRVWQSPGRCPRTKTSITFKIRQGVPFHKGWGEVTAEDVAWSFNNAKAEGNTNPRSGFWGEYTDRWEAIDSNTAIMHVKGNLSVRWTVELSNQWRSTGSVQSKKAYDDLGEEEANLNFAGHRAIRSHAMGAR